MSDIGSLELFRNRELTVWMVCCLCAELSPYYRITDDESKWTSEERKIMSEIDIWINFVATAIHHKKIRYIKAHRRETNHDSGKARVILDIDNYVVNPDDLKNLIESTTSLRPAFFFSDPAAKLLSNHYEPDEGSNRESVRLRIIRQAFFRFWRNADEHDKGSHPETEDIYAWISDQFESVGCEASAVIISNAIKIIKPDWIWKPKPSDWMPGQKGPD